MNPTVEKVTIQESGDLFDLRLIQYGGSAVAFLTLSDGSEQTFSWFHDELAYTISDFTGKTMKEIRAMHYERDMEYLRS